MVFPDCRSKRPLQKYNDQGLRLVVGFKVEGNEGASASGVEVLVVSSPKSQEMMFPKGGWEINESIEEAASRETLEEAGVLGSVEQELGVWTFKSKSQEIYHEGHMFPLLVVEELDSWPEKNSRERGWMTVDKAREACRQWWMKEALDKLIDRVHLHPSDQDELFTDSGVEDQVFNSTSMEENALPSSEN